jgi:hypothetical protein
MKANGKAVASIIMLIASVLGYLGLTFYPALNRTVSAENVFAGIIDSRPDDLAFIGWGNIESRHNVFTANPVQRVLVKRPDIFSGIPPNSQITRAILRLYTKDYNTQYCSDSAKRTYNAHKITQDWNPSSLTWRNQPSYQSTPTAQIQKAPKTDVNQWWEFDVTADIYSPYGWVIKEETEDAGGFFAWNYIVYIDTAEIYYEYTPPSYTLTVLVKDSDGSSVSGASITTPFSATTDTNGQASASLVYGSYTVTVSYLGRTYTQSVTLDSAKTVTITIPKYTLTVKVVDSANNPVQGAYITSPVSGQTDSNGVFSTSLRRGTYTVSAQGDSQTASTSVALDKATSVTLTLSLQYSLQLKIVDQLGHPLPATITVGSEKKSADKSGMTSFTVSRGQVSVYAEIRVKDKVYNSGTQTFSVTGSISKTITIERRFYWAFFFNYTDGTVPSTGTITLSCPRETLKVPLTNGVGEAYLLDETYKVVVEASPAVEIGTVSVQNDGEFFATLNKEKVTVEETSSNEVPTSSERSPVTQTEPTQVPWVLIPSVYIYSLIGVLAFGFILAALVALRRKR